MPIFWLALRGATKSLTLPKIANALSPTKEEIFDPETFLLNKGSLYLVGTKTGGGSVAPYLMALLDSLYSTATEIAFRSEGNRLDPPVSLILDEIANMSKWSTLAEAMSSGGGIGISTKPVFQSMAQARATWGKEEAQAIFDSAIIKIQLGGAGNVEDLKSISDLTGNRRITELSRSWNDSGRSDSEQTRNEEVISISELRRIPFGYAIVLSRSGRPVFLKMLRYIDRVDAQEIKASQKLFKQQLEKHKNNNSNLKDSTNEPETLPNTPNQSEIPTSTAETKRETGSRTASSAT